MSDKNSSDTDVHLILIWKFWLVHLDNTINNHSFFDPNQMENFISNYTKCKIWLYKLSWWWSCKRERLWSDCSIRRLICVYTVCLILFELIWLILKLWALGHVMWFRYLAYNQFFFLFISLNMCFWCSKNISLRWSLSTHCICLVEE